MRPIDADKLIKAFKDYPFGNFITPQGAIDVIDGFADAIAGAETIEAEPVKHGKWIKFDKYRLIHPIYFCSNCNDYTFTITPYCACCGAKMNDE
ncbi:MAG: hypothetical protein NC489_43980 [Ruminococcus flavefaciens]|nr:hypothetical protein [Ruminococcus flavefaciens]